MLDINKKKKKMLKEIITMETCIYLDMLRNVDLVNYDDLLSKYDEVYFCFKLLKLKVDVDDRNSC